jgi:hypothetical protein
MTVHLAYDPSLERRPLVFRRMIHPSPDQVRLTGAGRHRGRRPARELSGPSPSRPAADDDGGPGDRRGTGRCAGRVSDARVEDLRLVRGSRGPGVGARVSGLPQLSWVRRRKMGAFAVGSGLLYITVAEVRAKRDPSRREPG